MNSIILLKTAIEELDFSEDFIVACRKMRFNTLNDVIADGGENLFNREGFSYNWFGELITFLSDRKLLHLLQPLPGNNPD